MLQKKSFLRACRNDVGRDEQYEVELARAATGPAA